VLQFKSMMLCSHLNEDDRESCDQGDHHPDNAVGGRLLHDPCQATKPINEVDFSPGHEDARDVLLCVIAV
jgi:hypothetical protein